MGEWLDKLWDICIVEYSSVIRRTERLVGKASWMDQKGTMLRKKKSISKGYILCNFIIQHPQSKSTDTEKRSVVSRGGMRGECNTKRQLKGVLF